MQILRAEPLQPYNTLALEAIATALAVVETQPELLDAMAWAKAEGLPVIPLGEGSNIVLAGSPEALWLCQRSRGVEILEQGDGKVVLRVDAGHDWHQLVKRVLGDGFYGLENLALIPGTVGAAPIQNIGAYGVELERFVRAVHAIDLQTHQPLTLEAADCRFGYRDSIFKAELRDKLVITAVDFELSLVPAIELSYPALQDELSLRGCTDPTPADVFDAVVHVRRTRLPNPDTEPNAGSFFKNPVIPAQQAQALIGRWPEMPCYPQPDGSVKFPAAWLIDRAGWKGHQDEGVGVHSKHALVLVNQGSNSGAALLRLAEEIVRSVQSQFSIRLEMEPRVYGLK